MKKIILSSLVVLGLSSAAFAQGIDFTTADGDASGGVSIVEAQAVWPDLTPEIFATADVDGDGELSQAEYDALAAAAAPAQ